MSDSPVIIAFAMSIGIGLWCSLALAMHAFTERSSEILPRTIDSAGVAGS